MTRWNTIWNLEEYPNRKASAKVLWLESICKFEGLKDQWTLWTRLKVEGDDVGQVVRGQALQSFIVHGKIIQPRSDIIIYDFRSIILATAWKADYGGKSLDRKNMMIVGIRCSAVEMMKNILNWHMFKHVVWGKWKTHTQNHLVIFYEQITKRLSTTYHDRKYLERRNRQCGRGKSIVWFGSWLVWNDH